MVRAVDDVSAISFAAGDGTQEFLLDEKAAGRVAFFVEQGGCFRILRIRAAAFFRCAIERVIEERAIRHDDGRRHAERVIDLSHPDRVAAGEIFVHGHDMHALAGQCVQICGCHCGERLSFARHHFSDRALMDDHAADKLSVIWPLAESSFCGFARQVQKR